MGAGESVLDYARFKVEVAPQQSPSGSACAAVLPCCELLNAAAVNPATHRVQQDRASSFAVCGHVVVTVVKATAVPSLTVELSCQLGLVAGNGKLDVKRALLFHTLALPVPGGQLGLGEHRLPFALQVPAHAAALPPSLRWQNAKAALQVLWSIQITAIQPGLFGFSTSLLGGQKHVVATEKLHVRTGQLPEPHVLVGRSPFVLDSGFAWFRSVGRVEAHAVVGAHRCQLPGARQVETALFLANSSNVAVDLRSVKLVLELNLASSSDAIRIVDGKWELEPEAMFCRDESWSGPEKTDLRAHVAVRASSAAGAARVGKDGFGAAGKSTSLRMSLTLPLNLPLESFRFADTANVVSAEYKLTFTLETTAFFGKRFKVEIPLRVCHNGDGPPPAGSDSAVAAPPNTPTPPLSSLPRGAPAAFRPEAGPGDSKGWAPAPATLPTPSAPPAPPAASAPRREEQVPYATVVEEADEGLGAAVATATAVPTKELAHT